ncbi:MAG: RNA polymerase sigma factor [Aureispira sp.]|nr:RNA polymerase sigma factor [Aureispira sp.]
MQANNKQSYFLELYQPHHQKLLRYCESILKDSTDAEDLVSETVLIAYQDLHKLKKVEAFNYYLFGIARNLIRRKYRRKKFWGAFDKEQADQLPATQNPELDMDVRLLYDALDKLPEAQKEALILFELSGYSIKEVAAIQNSGLSAVKARLARGRKQLAKLLTSKVLTYD